MRAGKIFMGAAIAFAACGMAAAQEQARQCETRGTNGMVTLLLCPEGLDAEGMAREGKLACGERKPCGAWIWTDPAVVPAEAPDSHDKLAPEAIKASHGVWMNELDKMIVLQATPRN